MVKAAWNLIFKPWGQKTTIWNLPILIRDANFTTYHQWQRIPNVMGERERSKGPGFIAQLFRDGTGAGLGQNLANRCATSIALMKHWQPYGGNMKWPKMTSLALLGLYTPRRACWKWQTLCPRETSRSEQLPEVFFVTFSAEGIGRKKWCGGRMGDATLSHWLATVVLKDWESTDTMQGQAHPGALFIHSPG